MNLKIQISYLFLTFLYKESSVFNTYARTHNKKETYFFKCEKLHM